jgi:hypothetical protein
MVSAQHFHLAFSLIAITLEVLGLTKIVLFVFFFLGTGNHQLQ